MVIPIRDFGSRLPQAGRIRLGQKGKSGPKAIAEFRFTAPIEAPLLKIAELYGGTPRPWSEPRSTDRYEIYTGAQEISVVLPPDPLDVTYEMWSKAGRARRCDGITCGIYVPTEEGADLVEVPCKCAEAKILDCKVKLRLNVILPEVRGLGLWRLDSSSEYAAREMPGIVEAITALDGGQGMVRALLRVEQRHGTKITARGVQTRHYNVPVIDFAASLDEIVAGGAKASVGPPPLSGLPAGADPVSPPQTGIGPTHATPTHDGRSGSEGGGEDAGHDGKPNGAPSPPRSSTHPPASPDDEIVDAEIVDDIEEVSEWLALLPVKDQNKILRQARSVAAELGEPIPANFEGITGRTLETIYRAIKED